MNRARIRRQQQQQQRQQNPADFAPDPPPVPTPEQPATRTFPSPAPTPQNMAAPPVPTPPEQLGPATAPQVTFRDGLLTVVATNSNLIALLTAIRNKAGIQFEGLENGGQERVAIAMGPAPEGDVLAAILGGSSFDYVVLERPDSPGIVQRVVLTPRAGTTAAANSAPTARTPDADADDDEEAAEEPATPQDTPIRPPLAQIPPQPPPQAQPPTAEQIFEKLKQMPQNQTPQPQPNAPLKTAPVTPPQPKP
jgi:hypothetical protein